MSSETVTVDYELLDRQLKTMGQAIEFLGLKLSPSDQKRTEKVLRQNVADLEGLYELCCAIWEQRTLPDCREDDGLFAEQRRVNVPAQDTPGQATPAAWDPVEELRWMAQFMENTASFNGDSYRWYERVRRGLADVDGQPQTSGG